MTFADLAASVDFADVLACIVAISASILSAYVLLLGAGWICQLLGWDAEYGDWGPDPNDPNDLRNYD